MVWVLTSAFDGEKRSIYLLGYRKEPIPVAISFNTQGEWFANPTS
jgi:hypothetical protein